VLAALLALGARAVAPAGEAPGLEPVLVH